MAHPADMVWCEDKLVCLIYQTYILFVGGNSTHKREYQYDDRGIFVCSEVDGIRILTRKKSVILRILPDSYFYIFEPLSITPSSSLFG